MTKLLIVGGTFDHEGGRPSKLIDSIKTEIARSNWYDITFFNGGLVEDLHKNILPSVTDYKVVLWFANVPNDEVKLRDVKAINPKCILVTSKRNDDNKYTFAELISRALSIKANLTIEFSRQEDKFNMMLFDPLGNVFYNGLSVDLLCKNLIYRIYELSCFSRVPTIQDTVNEAPVVPEETAFFDFAHGCATIFHNLIRPAKGTERFLGNMSFRCQNGFPSFRGENDIIYVSKRNVDKSDIGASSFVPTYLDEELDVKYFGENKPSVDTPVQLRLYELFPWANYMLHAHCYIDSKLISMLIDDSVVTQTNAPVPCGAIEEVREIYASLPCSLDKVNQEPPRLLAVNLIGHGCILIARDVEVLKELEDHKNCCFTQRPMPENFERTDITITEDARKWLDEFFEESGKFAEDTRASRLRLIDDLHDIVTEIEARETASNCVVGRLGGYSWDGLCDTAIKILQTLKQTT